MEPTKVEPPEFVRAWVLEMLKDVRTVIPCRVLSYDKVKQTVEVEVGTVRVLRHDDGDETTQPPVVLQSVPVVFPGDSTSYLTFQIETGATGVLKVCDRSISAWRTDGKAHPPSIDGTHRLGDAVFEPGLRADPSPLPTASLGGTVLEAPKVQLGAGAVSPAVLGTALKTLWDSMVLYINTHTHSGVTTGVGASGPPVTPLSSDLTTAHSAKVFIE